MSWTNTSETPKKIEIMPKELKRSELIQRIKADPTQQYPIKLIANLYSHSKNNSEEEKLLYDVLLRRCQEELEIIEKAREKEILKNF